ncbi:MAG: sugar phosphate isomerase/epimerase [Parcubacteria group bacterium]|nr:sugar phosphate isomerase/epimerase [Parcubacteria group bacterium]
MIPEIGIMQGRLSPPQNGRFQFFPKDWQAEFSQAQQLGFDSIEWVYDEDNWNLRWGFNPILDREGREKIKKLSFWYNVGVRSICADYFINGGLSGFGDSKVSMLIALIFVARALRIKTIVLPFLEKATIKNRKQKKQIIKNINSALGLCCLYDVKLALETELDGPDLKRFIQKFNSPYVGVCYDLGNTVSYGHNSPWDIRLLDDLIFEVHIKDRKIGSNKSVNLGEGDVDFDGCFKALKSISFNGPMILQANRSDVYYLDDAKRQLDFVKTKWRN